MTAADSSITSPTHNPSPHISYMAERVIGHGSFGVVFLAKVVETGEVVAIKKVLQDKRYRSRELIMMRSIHHRNIVAMKHCFYSNGEKADELYLNLVLEFLPDTVHRFSKMFAKHREYMPLLYVKLFMYQLCRALAYLHNPSLNICHRDIKPQNLLMDPATGVMKLCDFGSAKQLLNGEPNISYICSRYYRAPELIFGSTNYTVAIDVWSCGAVLAELLIAQPLFPGETAVDQMVEVIKILGTPSKDDIAAMNKQYTDFAFPHIRPLPWSRVFPSHVPADAIDLVGQMLCYNPQRRITPLDAMCHPFFDELRDPKVLLPNGKPLPPLYDFSDVEKAYIPAPTLGKLLPK